MTNIIISPKELDKGGVTEVRSNELYYLATRERSNALTIIIPTGVTSAITFDTPLPTDQYDVLAELYNSTSSYIPTLSNMTRYGFTVTNSYNTPMMFNYRATRRTHDDEQNLFSVILNLSDDLGVVEGVTANVGRTSKISDTSGICTFTDISENIYLYGVTSNAHVEVNESIYVTGDTSINIILIRDKFNLDVTATDELLIPIENVLVTIDQDYQEYTDVNGLAQFVNLTTGYKSYELRKDGYNIVEGIIDFTSDSALTFKMTLVPLTYAISWTVVDGGSNPIDRAIIEMTVTPDVGESVVYNDMTNEEGILIFTDVIAGNCEYSVSKAAYETIFGSFTINANRDENVTLFDI